MREVGFAADEPGSQADAQAGSRPILLLLIACAGWEGEARSLEGGEWRWCTPAEIAQLPKPPLDAQLTAQFFD